MISSNKVYSMNSDVLTSSNKFLEARDAVLEAKVKRDSLLEKIDVKEREIKELEKVISDAGKARVIVQKVASETQSVVEYHISGVVGLAESATFDDPYGVELDFVERRNLTECDFYFTKGFDRFNPMASAGGGPLDVASFGIFIAIWSFGRTRPFLLLDEPFRFVSSNLQSRCSAMVKQITLDHNLQILMISHLPHMIDSADKVFEVTQDKHGISSVREVR